MSITIIAAIGKNRELGKNGDLIWHIPEDLKQLGDTVAEFDTKLATMVGKF